MAGYSWKQDVGVGGAALAQDEQDAAAEKTQEVKALVATALVAVVEDPDALNDERWRFAATAFKLAANKINYAAKNDSSSQGLKAANAAMDMSGEERGDVNGWVVSDDGATSSRAALKMTPEQRKAAVKNAMGA